MIDLPSRYFVPKGFSFYKMEIRQDFPQKKRKTSFNLFFRRRIGLPVLFCVLALAGSVLSVCTLGVSRYEWRGLGIEVQLLPSSQGLTRLELIPLGAIQAHTHLAPVTLVAGLREIRLDQVRDQLSAAPKPAALERDFLNIARQCLRQFILRQLVMAAIGGMLAPMLLHSRRLRYYLIGSLIGVVGVGAVLGNALTTFNSRAFASPTYTGALKQAPWVIQFGRDAFSKFETLSQKLRHVAANLNQLYGRIERMPGAGLLTESPGSFRVLHVSDIHNNGAALNFLREVADTFHVRLIVDTGDLTDFGSPPETLIVRGIGRLPYPYVFVAGNHDSQTVMQALAQLPNVTLLHGQWAQVGGLTLLGLPNPASARAGVGSVDTTPAEIETGGQALAQLAASRLLPPDIVAVHDPNEGRALWGHVPVILCGHLHRLYLEQHSPEGGEAQEPGQSFAGTPPVPLAHLPSPVPPHYATWVCNAGTTGAAGLRYFEKEQGVPFSCLVLTFREALLTPALSGAAARPHLIAVDEIVLDGTLGTYSITHRTVE